MMIRTRDPSEIGKLVIGAHVVYIRAGVMEIGVLMD